MGSPPKHGHHFGRGPPPQQPPSHHDHGHHHGGNGSPRPFSIPSNATVNLQPEAEAEKASSGDGSGAAPVSTPFTLQPVKVSTPGYAQSSFLKLGPCGGTGGDPFSTPLDENTKLLSVKVWEGPDGLAGIQTKYELSGETTTSPVWGTSQQDTQNFNEVTFDAEQGEILISITGTFGKSSEGDIVVVQSLCLVTNVATYGPVGNATNLTAREFSLTAGNDGQIIGFFGFSGALLESIGVLVKPPPSPAPMAETPSACATGLVLQGPSGGAGGEEFSMDLNADTRFLGFRMWVSEDIIYGLQMRYETVEGDSQYTTIFGGDLMVDLKLLQASFDQGRFFTSVRGTVGTGEEKFFNENGMPRSAGQTLAVTSLTFVTDDGVTYGPYGREEGGVPFSYTGKIVGFHGRGFRILRALGVIMAPN